MSPVEATIRRRFDSGESRLFVTLGELARKRGHLEEALSLLESGLKQHPEMISGWIVLARVRVQLGQFELAQEIYLHVHKHLDRRNIPALRALATSSIAAGRLGEAGDLLARLLKEDPCDYEAEDLQEEIRGSSEQMDWSSSPEQKMAAAAAGGLGDKPEPVNSDPDEMGRELIAAPSLSDLEAWGEDRSLGAEPAGGIKR
jgi:tetratricopeptide (TPR) repeat protein